MEIKLLPSIMCGDLVNLEKSVKELENLGLEYLHIDLIDGHFSKSMPLGIETVRSLREVTDLKFDVHIMSLDNEFFVKEMLDIGVSRISFHYETTRHVDYLINLIKNNGVQAGLALNPSTPLSVLDYPLYDIDFVTLMLINPGFAGSKNEKQVPYAENKIRDLRNLIDSRNRNVEISVDGRVSLETIEMLVKAGADNLVLGSTSLFRKDNTLVKNKEIIDQIIRRSK